MTIVSAFVLSSVGFSALVIWQLNQDNQDSSSQTADLQKQLEEQLAGQCSIQVPVPGKEAKAVPKTEKITSDVTKLQKKELKLGSGKAAAEGDCLVVKYNGTLAKTGKQFDGNFDSRDGLQFTLGKGEVIPGWDEGLADLKIGGIRQLIIPSDKAYGNRSAGEIPANSDLVFVIELLEIK